MMGDGNCHKCPHRRFHRIKDELWNSKIVESCDCPERKCENWDCKDCEYREDSQ